MKYTGLKKLHTRGRKTAGKGGLRRMGRLMAGLCSLSLCLTILPAAASAVDTASCGDGNHIWEEKVIKASTCLEYGRTLQVCRVCGQTGVEKAVQPLEHQFIVSVTLEPTADRKGYLTSCCLVCGEQYMDWLPELTAQQAAAPDCGDGNHVWEDKVIKEGSCESEGSAVEICAVCGRTGRGRAIPRLEHQFVSSVTLEPTTTQRGQRTTCCAVCGEEYVEWLPKLDAQEGRDEPQDSEAQDGETTGEGTKTPDAAEQLHVHSWSARTEAATCTKQGRSYRVCGTCGEEETISTMPKLAHTYTSEVTREATAEREGVRTYTCTVCGDSYTEAVEKLAAEKSGPRDSGSTAMKKLSQQEIKNLLAKASLTMPDKIFDEESSIYAPYATGKVSTAALQAATDRLNALRRIAGLPEVTLDMDLCKNAQYGAVLLAHIGTLNHFPTKPADMDQSFYQEAYKATSSSNLSAGRSLTGAVDAFMDDSDSSNISSLGHRQWQLNPNMGKVGFGYATSSTGYRRYSAEKVFDDSGVGCDYDFIGWPASGNFPAELFDGGTAWSVSLNPQTYQIPNSRDITVTVTSESSGRSWTMKAGGGDGYFNLVANGDGFQNCLIFRPNGIDAYEGVYTVSISGFKMKSGQEVKDFSYQVEFFDTASKPAVAPASTTQQTTTQQTTTQQTTTQPVFKDVASSHWAAAAIKTAVEQGIVNGYADGSFRPSAQVTNAHFHVMMARAFYSDELETAAAGEAWWEPGISANRSHGLLNGTALEAASLVGNSFGTAPDMAISRFDMAQIMYNLLLDRKAELPQEGELKKAQASIADWASIPAGYREAVSTCYAMGLLNGQNDGTFGGTSAMNRAQGCTVICRLWEQLSA